jgi:multidrug efflux pump subunit AcrB
VLSFDVQQPNPYYGQIVIVTKSYEIRHRVQQKLEKILRDEFVGTDTLVKALELGPPVGRPIQYRLSGPDIQQLRSLALEFAGVIDVNPNLSAVTYDWNEPARMLKVDVNQDKARRSASPRKAFRRR